MSNEVTLQHHHRLPSLSEIINETDESIKENQLMVLLNQPPPEQWVKVHPYIKGYKYLPIGRIEYLLKRIFTSYKIEVLKTGILFNSVEVTVRVHFRNPITREWDFHDGLGACELQTQKDTGALKLDMSNVNKSAVEMALPIAKSKAIKDACDHFGRLFGSDLNHKEQFDFTPLLKDNPTIDDVKELYDMKSNLLSADEVKDIDRIINNNETASFKKATKLLLSK